MPFDVITASDRTLQTIHAASIFHNYADVVAAACADASEGELVVGAVSHDQAFRGIWTIPRTELGALVASLDDGGWVLVFSPHTDVAEIEERCLKLARGAFTRWEAMRRWVSHHR